MEQSKNVDEAEREQRSLATKLYFVSFFGNLSLDLSIWFFYFTKVGGLSVSAATAIHSLIFLTIGLTDLPTGAWADLIGRRRLAIIGYCLRLIGVLISVFAPNIYGLLLASVVTGLGWALLSGTIEAFLFDNLKAIGREQNYQGIFANTMSFCFAARCLGFFSATLLFELNPVFPYYVMAIGICSAMLFLSFIHEAPYQASEAGNSLQQIKIGLKAIANTPIFHSFLVPWMLISSLSEVVWMTFQPLFEQSEASLRWTGALYAIGALGSLVGSQVVKRINSDTGSVKLFAIYGLGVLTGCLAFILGGSFCALAAGSFLISIGWGLAYPFQSALINRNIKSSERATSLSAYSSLTMVLEASLCALFGVITEQYSPRVTLGAVLIVATVILGYISARFSFNARNAAD